MAVRVGRLLKSRFTKEGCEVEIIIKVHGQSPGEDLLDMAKIASSEFLNQERGILEQITEEAGGDAGKETGEETKH